MVVVTELGSWLTVAGLSAALRPGRSVSVYMGLDGRCYTIEVDYNSVHGNICTCVQQQNRKVLCCRQSCDTCA